MGAGAAPRRGSGARCCAVARTDRCPPPRTRRPGGSTSSDRSRAQRSPSRGPGSAAGSAPRAHRRSRRATTAAGAASALRGGGVPSVAACVEARAFRCSATRRSSASTARACAVPASRAATQPQAASATAIADQTPSAIRAPAGRVRVRGGLTRLRYEGRDRLRTALAAVEPAEHLERRIESRVGLQRAHEQRLGLAEPPAVDVPRGQIVQGDRLRGVDLEHLPPVDRRLRTLPAGVERVAEVQVALGKRRIRFDRLPEVGDGLGRVPPSRRRVPRLLFAISESGCRASVCRQSAMPST